MSTRGDKGRVIAGSMRQRIRIESPVLASDGLGGAARSWETVAILWGEIRGVSGNETFFGGQLAGQVTHRVTLRWREGITPEMRIRFGTRIFAIRAILERDGKKRSLEILAEEGAGS